MDGRMNSTRGGEEERANYARRTRELRSVVVPVAETHQQSLL